MFGVVSYLIFEIDNLLGTRQKHELKFVQTHRVKEKGMSDKS
jgi:hypothetical protein